MVLVRKKAMKDLNLYFNFKSTDNVVYWMFFYSKSCYVLSKEQSEKLDRLLVNMSLKLFSFGSIYFILFANVIERSLFEAIFTLATVSIFMFYCWRLLRIINGGVKVSLSEFASEVYPRFIAKHSPKDKLSKLVRHTFRILIMLSIMLLLVFYNGYYSVFFLCFLFVLFLWSGWLLLYRADNIY